MAHVIPCIRGEMGSTTYYIGKMNARELVSSVRPASEIDAWANMGIEERMQREYNMKRIEGEIAPYLAKQKDRFFGSVIVLVYRGELFFEGISDFSPKIPKAYRTSGEDIGFLTIDGGSLIMLDGQHRLLAFEKVVKGNVPGDCAQDVPNDEISVIFINHESSEKTRRIFNKVNRYAKTTSRGDNIITSEDDGYAIIARRLLNEDGPFGGSALVNWKSNTLSARSSQLTTISVIYETVKLILACPALTSANGPIKLNDQLRPSDDDIDRYLEVVESVWSSVLQGFLPYRNAIANPSTIAPNRVDSAPYSLLFKPAAQVALFKGLLTAVDRKYLTLDEGINRANRIDWSISSDLWKNILIAPNGSISTGSEAQNRAALLITYLLAGDKMAETDIKIVRDMYAEARGLPISDDLLPPVVIVS